MQLAKAFMVVNTSQLTQSEGLKAHSGEQYLMATCPEYQESLSGVPGPANDWLISPVLDGKSYVSFYIDIISETYPETYRLMTSSTGTAEADFTELASFTKSKKGWENIECRLPEGARYFAINYVSRDKFGILVDDITYRSADSKYVVEKYNIYRDGEKIGESDATSYLDKTALENHTYRYFVTTQAEGEGIPSNAVSITTSSAAAITAGMRIGTETGNIVIEGFSGRDVVVCDTFGRIIFRGEADSDHMAIAVALGVYVVRAAGVTRKVIVR